MIRFDVFDMTGTQIQSIYMVNAELYAGLMLGVIMAGIFWLIIKGSE